jgi:hypothetical protein
MLAYFKVLLETIGHFIILFYEIVKYKIKLILWEQPTEAILFTSFLKYEQTQIFIEYYFPKLFQKFIYLLKETLSCKGNES